MYIINNINRPLGINTYGVQKKYQIKEHYTSLIGGGGAHYINIPDSKAIGGQRKVDIKGKDKNGNYLGTDGKTYDKITGKIITTLKPQTFNTARPHNYDKSVEYRWYNGTWQARYTKGKDTNWYNVAEGSTGYDRFGNHNRFKNGKWVKIKEDNPTGGSTLQRSQKPRLDPNRFVSIYDTAGLWKQHAQDNNLTDRDSVRRFQKEVLGFDDTQADGIWGGNTEAAYSRWKANKDAATLQLNSPVKQITISNTPISRWDTNENLKGRFNNYASMQNYINSNPEDSFSKAMITRFGNTDTWNQQDVENALDVAGTYRGSDRRDIANSFNNYYQQQQKTDNNIKNIINNTNQTMNNWRNFTSNLGLFKNGGLISRNPITRFKQGGMLRKFAGGGPYYIMGVYNGKTFRKEFETTQEAQAWKEKHPRIGGRIQFANSEAQVIMSDRSNDPATAGNRKQLERYNHLTRQQAYNRATKEGKGLFAYKGKVYTTGNKVSNNEKLMYQKYYGEKLGWGNNKNIHNSASRKARANYRNEEEAKKAFNDPKNKRQRPETNSSANEKADKYANAVALNGGEFGDMAYTALTNTPIAVTRASYDWATGKEFNPTQYMSYQKFGFDPFGWIGALENAQQGDWSDVVDRGVDAGAWLIAPAVGRGVATVVDKVATKFAPRIANLGPKSAYINRGGTVVDEAGNRVLNTWNQNALKGKGTLFNNTGTKLYGQRSIQRAVNEGALDQFAVNGGFNNATRYGTNLLQNVNTGTGYVYSGGAPVMYDVAADAAVNTTPVLVTPAVGLTGEMLVK